jgi:hypothetical protein
LIAILDLFLGLIHLENEGNFLKHRNTRIA